MNKDEQSILSRMIEIYKPDGYDWMGTKEKRIILLLIII